MKQTRTTLSKRAKTSSVKKHQDSLFSPKSTSLLNAGALAGLTTSRRSHAPLMSSTKRLFSTETPTPTSSVRPKVVYENPISTARKVYSKIIPTLPVVSLSLLANTMLVSPDLSTAIPTIASILSFDLLRRHVKDQRTTVTEVVVRGETDPVDVTVLSLLGNPRKKTIPRDQFVGLYPYQDSIAFSGNKAPLHMNLKDETLFLGRDGLFDTTGSLTPLLGYDITTFQRAPPSQPFDPNAKNQRK